MLGAIVGDIAGSAYEFDNTRDYHCKLFPKGCDFTDDSVMTMAVASWLLKDPEHTHKVLEEEMVRYANAYPNPKGGYGGGCEWGQESGVLLDEAVKEVFERLGK